MKALYLTLRSFTLIKNQVLIVVFACFVSISYAQQPGTIVISKKVALDFSPGVNFGFTSNIPSVQSFTLNDDPEFVSVQDLGIGGNNRMWIVAAPASGTGNGTVYYKTAGSTNWVQTAGSGTRIDVNTAGTAVLINQQGSQFLWNENSGFVQQTNMSYSAVDVGAYAGSGRNAYFLANNNSGCNILVERLGGGFYNYYQNICGTRLDVGPDGSVYVLNETAGQVYKVAFSDNNTIATIAQTYTSISFNDIAVAVDGSVWAVNATKCYRLIGGNWVVDANSSGVGSGFNAAGISVGYDSDTPIITYNAKSNVSNALRGRIIQRREDGTWMNDHAVHGLVSGNSVILNVSPGTYTVTESASPWQLTAINSAGGSVSKNIPVRSATVNVQANETVHLEFVNEGIDYGDAPNSFSTLKASGGPSHIITSLLTLGSRIDPEADGTESTTATGDNSNDVNDEDGISAFPVISGTTNTAITNYSVNVSVRNETTSTANLCGWIDWNNNGAFEAGEGVCKTLAPTSAETTLVWPAAVLAGSSGATGVYARFRLTTGSLTTGSAKGAALDGEVEDYFIEFTNPLPVKMTTFGASVHESNVVINWTTTEETNADRFEIEHSLNGKTWNLAGTVAAKGESSALLNYTFQHKTPANGQNLYRLKMIDYDNTFAYSRILSVFLDKNLTFTAYPNPASNSVKISNYDQVKQITIYNGLGVKVVENHKLLAKGIDVTKLQQGIYTISIIQFDGTVCTQKVLLVR